MGVFVCVHAREWTVDKDSLYLAKNYQCQQVGKNKSRPRGRKTGGRHRSARARASKT